jgi:hypothetical protein
MLELLQGIESRKPVHFTDSLKPTQVTHLMNTLSMGWYDGF